MFLPCGASPFSSFTGSLVARIILFLASPAACCILLRTATPQASWPAPAALPFHWKQRNAWGNSSVCVGVCAQRTWLPLRLYLSYWQHLWLFFVDVYTDQNECKDFGSVVCGTWRCENTIGSYRCVMGCQPGLEGEDNADCGEWLNRT